MYVVWVVWLMYYHEVSVRNKLKKHSVTKNCSDLSMFEKNEIVREWCRGYVISAQCSECESEEIRLSEGIDKIKKIMSTMTHNLKLWSMGQNLINA